MARLVLAALELDLQLLRPTVLDLGAEPVGRSC
jgi:hypothetical protein